MKKVPGQTVKAAGILLISDRVKPTHFLLMRHRDRWDLPKGHCEEGETLEETALRETEEETGIARTDITLDPTFRFELNYHVTYKKFGDLTFEKYVCYFIGYVHGRPTIELTEHESAEWFTWEPPQPPIQSETIDPLVSAAATHLLRPTKSP